MNFIARILIFAISGLRPLLGPASCRFYPTCGAFALQTLKTKPLLPALWIITTRVCSCLPFFKKRNFS